MSYRETIRRAVEVTGECHRNVAGQMLFAKLRIRMEPFSKGGKNRSRLPSPFGERGQGGVRASAKPVIVAVAPGGGLPESFLTAAVEVLSEQGEGGGMLGFP